MPKLIPEHAAAIAVVNPASSRARQADRHLRAVAERVMPVLRVETRADQAEAGRTEDEIVAAADRIRSLGRQAVLLSAGGDGTLKDLETFVASSPKAENIRDIPLGAVSAGFCNDDSRSLNGSVSPERFLRHGNIRAVRPLESHIVQPDGMVQTLFALGYIGIGDTAAGSEKVNATRGRANLLTRTGPGRLGQKAVAALQGTAAYPGLMVREAAGSPALVGGLLFCRGDRIAGTAGPHSSFGRDEFEIFRTQPKGYAGTVMDILRMQRGRLPGELTAAPQSFFAYGVDGGASIPLQAGGETFSIPSGSHITIGLSEHAVQLITTLHPAGS